MTPQQNAEKRWESLTFEQGWNEESQISLFSGFLTRAWMWKEFLAYAQEAADEENGL